VQENQVLFSVGGVWLTTRRIDGQFPNYRQLLPESFEHELTISRAELIDVVRRAAVMIQRATPLQLRFAEGEVTVIATGGLAPLVVDESETITDHRPDLTLLGLRLVFERNTR